MALNLGAIPMPTSGGDAFFNSAAQTQSIIDSLMKNKLVPSEMELKHAQATKANMISNLIDQVMNGGGASGAGGANKGALLSGLLGIPTQTQVIDGKIVQSNPFTGTNASQVGETPEQKSNREQRQAVGTKTQEADYIKSQKLEDAALTLQNSHSLYRQLKDILDKHPNLTGIGSGFASKLNMSTNEDLANFQPLAGMAQAELARFGSQRGGSQALKWAEDNKPGIFKPGKYNQGMIKGTLNFLQNDYDNLNEEYRHLTGKNLPHKLDSSANFNGSNPVNTAPVSGQSSGLSNEKPITILYKGNQEYHIPPNLMQEALKHGFSLSSTGGQ